MSSKTNALNLEGNHLPTEGKSLWDATVHPSLQGSGVLPPNPIFSETPLSEAPTPEMDELLTAFSTRVDLNRIVGTFP